jgi:hypothetical protein
MSTSWQEILSSREKHGSTTLSPSLKFGLFVALMFLSLTPFWTVRYPAIPDYPNHLARWFVLHHAHDGFYRFSDLYAPAWGPLPYVTPDILAVALQYVLPIDIVGRLILSLCVVSIVLAVTLFVKTTCPENLGLAVFGIVIAFNPNFMMGSISNEISIACCFLAVSLWVVYLSAPRLSAAVGVGFCLIAVYLSHLIGFMVAGLAMGVYTIFQKKPLKKLVLLAALSMPSLALCAYNQLLSGGPSRFVYTGLTISEKLRSLVFPVRFFISKSMDTWMLIALAALVGSLTLSRQRIRIQPAWLAVCAVLLLAYFLAPGEFGDGGYADVRILPFLYLFSLAAFRFSQIPRYVVVSLVILALFRTVAVERLFISRQAELEQISAAFDAVPRGSRVLPVVVSEQSRGLVGRGDLHHLDYGVIQRGLLVPSLFHHRGVQPIRINDSAYCPNVYCWITYESDKKWDKIAQTYDYLWVQNDPDLPSIPDSIKTVVFANGYVTLYRLKNINQ